MKHFLLIASSFLICYSYSQVTANAPTTIDGLISNAAGGSPTLSLRLLDIKVNNNDAGQYIGKTIGSPYENELYTLSKVFYGDELLGNFYTRYNAMNSTVEIKKTTLVDEKPKRLLADKNIKIELNNKLLLFSTFITKEEKTINGYLSKIFDSENYTLYNRLAVKYSEGQAAANSMVNPKPSRYVHFKEFYFTNKNYNAINEIIPKSKRFIKNFSSEKRLLIKEFIKTEKIDLKNENDLIKVFKYLETI